MAEKKEWTLMFYFASDNPLAPGIVSQLKALKQAGFHPDANVIAQFDPHTVDTPTHIFEVNLVNKSKKPGKPNIGFARNDPFVRTLMEDKLWRDQKNRHGKLVRSQIKKSLKEQGFEYDPPTPPDGISTNRLPKNSRPQEAGPRESLTSFLNLCVKSYPANHYMLFILGHGLIVGNDVFLFDEHADEPSLSLIGLDDILKGFKDKVDAQQSQFELLSFHSCSVSSLEVAYQLQGKANYMLASQGPAFVGSWPYRQILIRIFNDLAKQGKELNVKAMLKDIFDFCLHNSTDFMLAGYSFDLCLSNLNKVGYIKEPLKALADLLAESLKELAKALDEEPDDADPTVKDYVLLAHLKAQSYWQESYTDLYDFCFCLSTQCEAGLKQAQGKMYDTLHAINVACNDVMDVLVKERKESKESKETDDNLIVRAEFAGPAYQYSHGLSVFFPWSEPSSDNPNWSKTTADGKKIKGRYEQYKFEETSWRNFLQTYFDITMRETHKEESTRDRRESSPRVESEEDALLEDIASLVFNDEGQLNRNETLGGGKTAPADPTGDECTCASVKNYPHDTRARRDRGKQAGTPQEAIPLSLTFRSRFLKT